MTIDPSTEAQPGTDRAEPAVTPEEPLPSAAQPELEAPAETLAGYVRRWWQGVRAGELGSLPIVVGLVVIALVFGTLDDTFFTERNFTNLLLQMAAISTIAIGVVFVLLIGEIDLSVAFVSAVGGVSMTLLLRPDASDWPWWAVIAVALILSLLSGFYAARHFAINTDINTMISADLPWRQRELAMEKAFPQRAELILVVVDAPIPEYAEAAASTLAGPRSIAV